MKYQKLHKFNARQEEGSFCRPENDHEHRSRAVSNTNDQNQSSYNSQKVRSLMKAMHRVLSSGEQQRQSPRTPDPATRNVGFDQLEEDFEKFKNESHERASANAQ